MMENIESKILIFDCNFGWDGDNSLKFLSEIAS